MSNYATISSKVDVVTERGVREHERIRNRVLREAVVLDADHTTD